MFSPIPFAIAIVPVAMYLLMIGMFRVRRRPLVTTGWRDAAALGIAIIGLVVVGPMQLFFPVYAAARFAGWVWIMLLALYVLSLLLVVLSCRPRLIVYGQGQEAFFQSLLLAASRVDPGAQWHGQVLSLPTVGLQLAYEPSGARGVQHAVSVNNFDRIDHWMQLERELVKVCADTHATEQGWAGRMLMAIGAVMITISVSMIAQQPVQSLIDLREFFIR